MPWTLVFGLVGALSISALPLTNGFVSKPLIVQASTDIPAELASWLFPWTYLVLVIASAGVSLHAGIKFPWFVFFAKDSGLRPKEAPKHMLLAMGVVAFLCIGLGVFPQPLYDMLPHADVMQVYTADHVVLQLEILLASAFAFFLLLPVLKRSDTITLDTDWFYRRAGRGFVRFAEGPLTRLFGAHSRIVHETLPRALRFVARNPAGFMRLAWERAALGLAGLTGSEDVIDRAQARYATLRDHYRDTRAAESWPIGQSVLFVALLLAVAVLVLVLS
jgi:multicomponent Na+:H+ antiporter subunit D